MLFTGSGDYGAAAEVLFSWWLPYCCRWMFTLSYRLCQNTGWRYVCPHPLGFIWHCGLWNPFEIPPNGYTCTCITKFILSLLQYHDKIMDSTLGPSSNLSRFRYQVKIGKPSKCWREPCFPMWYDSSNYCISTTDCQEGLYLLCMMDNIWREQISPWMLIIIVV